ncbi:LamG-like jellyroll fold domain-containing protein [Microbulbifer sp. SAOS-129_SWC]|uniref:LamG-like jellyroll fold domain-containing protein n=1 Tax=Microbulbifer sp. SAOS-129_SWC TaxID=3145235 RepID=UPI00321800EF
MNRLVGLAFALSLGVCAQTQAAPSIESENIAIDENTARGMVIGQVSASNGTFTSTMQLEVGAQSIGNWSTRGEDYEPISFSSPFSTSPIVLSQIQSYGDYPVIYSTHTDAYTGKVSKRGYEILFRPRQKNTSSTGFDAILETDLQTSDYATTSIDSVGGAETVGWMAFANSTQGRWGGIPFEVAQTGSVVTAATQTVNFTGPFDEAPHLLATVATSHGTDQTGVGIKQIANSLADVYMDALDDGGHTAEAVSMMMLQGNGVLHDVNGNAIGEVGSLTFSDRDRDHAGTVGLLRSYENPVVFVQPVGIDEEVYDAVFRFTAINSDSFSGYLHDIAEYRAWAKHGKFDLQYFVFEAGSWTIGIENYSYAISAGNDSGAFAIDPDTGEITVADSSQLDYESGITEYTITIQVSDGNGNIGTQTVTVSINNVADSLNSDASALHGVATGDWTGWNVASAGDVNGDGFDDVIVGAPQDDTNGEDAGRAYVLFGNANGVLADLDTVASGSGGFAINGQSAGDRTGFAVGGGGDINGDGLDDVVVGAPYATPTGDQEGLAFVVFGKADTAPVELSSIATEVGNGGFVVYGSGYRDHLGGTITVGDVNGDGLADVALGEVFRQSNDATYFLNLNRQKDESLVYVVYGKADSAAVRVADIVDGSYAGGFVVSKTGKTNTYGWQFGAQVLPVGDFNSDGLQDFIVNRGLLGDNEGTNRLLFGYPHTGAIEYDTISSSGYGLSILPEDGHYGVTSQNRHNALPGFTTAALGDVNGDGLDDIALLAADTGCCNGWQYPRAYIVFGTSTQQDIDLAEIAAGHGGFVIHNDASGVTLNTDDVVFGAIGGSGDINGDGYGDIIIGDPYADSGNGRLYVVYGKSDTGAVYLSDVVNDNGGFYTSGNGGDGVGHWVASAGDINGDGIADMLFGAPEADADGITDSGTLYVMLGKGAKVTQWGSAGDDSLTGTADFADALAGGQGNDILQGAGGEDVLYGGPGDDTIIISDDKFVRIDGGRGTDTLKFDGAGLFVNLAAAAQRVRSIEVFDITGSGANTLSFNKSVSGGNRIIVKGDLDDSVYSTSQQWQLSNTTETLDGIVFDVYTAGSAQLWLQHGLSISINAAPSIGDQAFSVDEYSTGGTALGNVSADASDIGDTVTYAIVAGNEAGYFSIDSTSGELSLADSVHQLDYESGASYGLTVEVTDSYGLTAQGLVTIDVNNLSTITRNMPMDASGGGSIWADWNSLLPALGESTTVGMKHSLNFADIPGLPIDTSLMDLSMAGVFSLETSLQVTGGTVEANLPVQLSVSYPDEIQPGGRVELTTSLAFADGAGFTVTSPSFKAEATETLTDYDFRLTTEVPDVISSSIDTYKGHISGDRISQPYSVESTGSVSATSQQSADNALRLEAEIARPAWVNEQVLAPDNWLSNALSLNGEKEGCKDGVFEPEGEDLYYKLGYSLFDSYLWATADLYQNFSVELSPVAVLTLEDGTSYSFDPREGLVLTPDNSNDSNGDGVIDASLDVSLNPVFTNATDFNAMLRVPFKTAEVHYNLQEAQCTNFQDYKFGKGGIYYEYAKVGPMVDTEFSIDLADVNGSGDWLSKVFSYSLSGITYTEKLSFDLCDGTGTACAPVLNTPPTATDVKVSGRVRQGEALAGTYLYSDTDGDSESGSSVQWQLAVDANGAGSTPIGGANATSFTPSSNYAGNYLQFCVTPADGIDSGSQVCSDWALVEGEISPAVSAGFYKALLLDGAGQYARVPMNSLFNPAYTSFTVETWLKMDSLSSNEQRLVQQLDLSGSGRTLLGIQSDGTVFTRMGGTLLNGATVLEADTWHHAAVSFDQATSTVRLYLDGELEAEDVRSAGSSFGDLVLGVNKNLSGSYFAGALDETRVWTAARDQAEIQRDMALSVSADEANLLLYFNYDDGDSNSLADVTGNFAGDLYNAPVYTFSTEKGLSLDGDGDYAEVSDSSDLEFGNGSFTVESWVYADANSAGDYRNIVSKKLGTGTDAGWVLRLGNDNDILKASFLLGDGTNSKGLASDTPLTLDTWNHIAVTVDRVTDTARLYVNGEEVKSVSLSGIGSVNSGTVMRIGTWSTVTNAPWLGEIDEVRVWDKAVSQTEIAANMHKRLDASTDGLVAYYTFEGAEDGTAKDMTGNGHDGSLYGDAVISDLGIGVASQGSGTLSGVLPGGNGIRFRLDTPPSIGQVSIDKTTGAFSYSPANAAATGSDSFRYYVVDADGHYSYSETVNLSLQ